MKQFITFLRQHWSQERIKIVLIFLCVIASQSLSLLEPSFFTKILDDFLRRADQPNAFASADAFFYQLGIVILLWVATAFGARIFKNFQQFLVATVSDRIGIRVFERAVDHVLHLPISYHAQHPTGEVFRRITKARDDVTELFNVFFDKIFQNIFSISVVLIYVFYREWRIGLALIGFVPIFFVVTYFFTRKIKQTQNDINTANESLYGTTLQAMNNIEVVKSFATEELEMARAHHDQTLAHKNLRRKTVSYQYLGFWQGTVINLARVVLLWYGSILAFQGQLTFGDVVLFTFYSFVVYQPLYELGTIYSKYHEGINAVDRLQQIFTQPLAREAQTPGTFEPTTFAGRIEFRDVSFAYNPDRQILQHLSFVVEPGKKLAIVGTSGNGKSTIIKLLLGFYQPTSGQILVDGHDLFEYNLYWLRRHIGVVLQDTTLFHTSLGDNVSYGTPKATADAIATATTQAQLQPLLHKLPQGLETRVGERGVMLSGGERQRVAIARAVIKQPAVYIFDEATSSLDSNSEELIKNAIATIAANRTTITISHRFSTVVDADEIILLEHGTVAERGTHSQLVAANGHYAQLHQLQSQSHTNDA